MNPPPITKTLLRADISFIRTVLRQVEASLKVDDWRDVENAFVEIGALANTIECCARDTYINAK